MRNLSLGVDYVRLFSEMEAKAGRFDVILPDHLWLGLCKICDLPPEKVNHLIPVNEKKQQALSDEIANLRKWFESKSIDLTRLRRKLRALLSQEGRVKEHASLSDQSIALLNTVDDLAKTDRAEKACLVHLAQALINNPPPRAC